MRVRGKIGTTPITILIDTGSTHNFLDQKIRERLALLIDREKSLKVMVADGSRISCNGVCKEVFLNLSDMGFHVDFYLLELGGCDAKLGTQWLQSLGPVVWDMSQLSMEFAFHDQRVKLQGLRPSPAKAISAKAMSRVLRDNGG